MAQDSTGSRLGRNGNQGLSAKVCEAASYTGLEGDHAQGPRLSLSQGTYCQFHN